METCGPQVEFPLPGPQRYVLGIWGHDIGHLVGASKV